MASASSSALSISSSSTRVDAKAPRQTTAASPQCVTLPTLPPPPVQSQSRPWKTTAYCKFKDISRFTNHAVDHAWSLSFPGRKIARNVMAMATGEAPAEVATAEMPEIVKTIRDTVRIVASFSSSFSCYYTGFCIYNTNMLLVFSGIKLRTSML